jgi:uncharacterized protein (TIGR03437 family)
VDLTGLRFLLFNSLLTFAISSPLSAAPKLRLDTTAIGPLPVALGTNAGSRTLIASNAGDALLNLSAASSAPWLTAAVQKAQSCGALVGQCNPVSISFNTASLSKGTYTGTITISDPNAIDAPQSVTVTVIIGGGVPDALTLYVPANGTPVTQKFNTARPVSTSASGPGSVSLSIAAPGGGSFADTFSYTLTARAQPGATDGTYNGSMSVSGSSIASENKTVPLTLNVSSQPIAALSTIGPFRIAQGAARQTQYIAVSNLSTGSLALAAPTVAVTSGGSTWLTAQLVSGFVGVAADPTGLSTGSYQGTVTVNSNAANSSVAVPVQLEILSPAAPYARPGGVLNNATFENGMQIAQGELPAVFGDQFTTEEPKLAGGAPWPTILGGASVYVNDQAVPLYYVSAGQINFQVPFDAQTGIGTVRVDRDGMRGNTVSVTIARYAPKLHIAVNENGDVASTPFGGSAAAVRAGSYFTIYALGFGQTAPAVRTGEAAPATPFALVPGTSNQVYFGAGGLFGNPLGTTPQFLGLAPGYVGLYQINVPVPSNAPKGKAVPVFYQGDAGTSNQLLFNIQ